MLLSKKERLVWIFAICIAIISTAFVTSQTIHQQNASTNKASQKEFTDIGKEAETWFSGVTSANRRQPPTPARYQYDQIKDIETPLLIYQDAIKNNAPWINFPEQIALHTFYPPSEIEGFVPTETTIYYYNENIETVTIILFGTFNATETRFDFVRIDNIWKLVWVGQRSINLH